MTLNEIKKVLRCSKNISFTSKYIIVYRGASVIIYDHELVCQKKILNLKYVYYGYVSPDETKLLLVSADNHYYIFSLESFSMLSAHTIKAPYNGNLEGMACWYSDDSFLLPVQNPVSMLSTLRKYNCDSSASFKDYLVESFYIIYVTFVKQKDKYLIIGLDRNECLARDEFAWYLIWMDMDEKFTIYKIKDFNETINRFDICYDTETIYLTGDSAVYSYDFYGVPSNTIKKHHLENIVYHGFPLCFRHSKNNDSIVYLGTSNELIIYDIKRHLTIKSYSMEFGASEIIEFGDIIFVSSIDGVKPISLI